jgi:GNAT superfamily N-acetyltransferase
MAGLTEHWEAALDARRSLRPRSPVAVLDPAAEGTPLGTSGGRRRRNAECTDYRASARLTNMTVHQSTEFLQLTRPGDVTPSLRRELIDCWETVANAGGAVLATEFPPLPVSARDVAPVLDGLVHALHPRHGRLLVSAVGGSLAGWLVLRREPHPLGSHCGTVNHVQTHPRSRGRGIGVALMHRVRDVARDEMGLERLSLSARGGVGLEEFYRRVGWVEVGRWPGALRIAPGDDRDEFLMSLAL